MQIDKRSRTELKQYFVKNAIPTERNFADLIDGMLSQRDDGIAKLPNDPLSIEAVGDDAGQQKVLQLYRSFSDSSPSWVLSLNPRQNPADPATARAGFSISDGDGISRLFIEKGTGNVGIGTFPSVAKLQVAGSAVFAGTVNAGDYPPAAGEVNAPNMEIGGRDPIPDGTRGGILYLHDHGRVAHQLRYTNGTLFFEATSNGYGTWPQPMLDLSGHLTVQGDLEIENTASLGWARGGADFNAPLRNGLYQSNSQAGSPPDVSGWWHLIAVRHNNPENHHQLQIASSYAENDRLFFRKIARPLTDDRRPPWNEIATVTNGILKVGEWTIESAGDALYIKRGTAIVARFSTARDRIKVFKDLNGAAPYFYFNEEGGYGLQR